ncbi:MAG: NAD(P)/FAD-dependent oxidoreductase [Thermodesulfobacteriota bacterium]
MTQKQYVIVGTGPAGINAAKTLRSKDSEAKIMLVGQESVYPYSPTVLPYFISGKIKERDLFLSGEHDLSKHQIELTRGNGAISVSPKEGKVYLKDGSSLNYDALILAQGGSPVLPGIPGLKECNPFVLRTLADAKRLKSKAQRSSKAIVLGGGLIGMHTAQSLAEAGLSVSVIELMDQILPGYFDKKATAIIQKVYEAHRIRFFTSTEVEEVAFRKGDYFVSLKGGKRIEAPLFLVATGVWPNVDFLKGSGIEVDKGILVDPGMRTNVPNIFAAGDVVQTESFWGGVKVNQPILIHAVDQGRMAAASAIGEKVSHAGNISVNLFHFFGHRGLSIGLVSPDGRDRLEVHQSDLPSKGRYLKLVFDEDILVGVMGIDSDLDSGILLQMIRRRIPLHGEKKEFLKRPLDMGRRLMCQKWR